MYYFGFFIFLYYLFYYGVSYIESIRNSNYYALICVGLSVGSGLLWAHINGKYSQNSKDVFIAGMVFDIGATAAMLIAPVFIGKMNVGTKELLGIALIVLGTYLIK